MYRLELTTIWGYVFLSPFVYTAHEAKTRLAKLSWLVNERRGARMIPVSCGKYPAKAKWEESMETLTGIGLDRRIAHVQRLWRELKTTHGG